MATMTFQYGGYFAFNLILLENNAGDPHFLLHKTLYHTVWMYFGKFKKLYNAKNFRIRKTSFFSLNFFFHDRIFLNLLK